MKKQNGITLIALVITIIVLLILATVSIIAITGENGIGKKARDAAYKTEEAKKEEMDNLEDLEKEIDNAINGGFPYGALYTVTFDDMINGLGLVIYEDGSYEIYDVELDGMDVVLSDEFEAGTFVVDGNKIKVNKEGFERRSNNDI